MLGLGIAYSTPTYVKQMKKVFKANDMDLSNLAFFAITLANEINGQRLPSPRYYLIAYDLNGEKIGELPRLQVFPDGWNKKEPFWEGLLGKLKFSNLFNNT